MAALVDDDLLDAVVVRGDPDQVADRLHARFAGHVDRLAVYAPGGLADDALAAVVAALRQRLKTSTSDQRRASTGSRAPRSDGAAPAGET